LLFFFLILYFWLRCLKNSIRKSGYTETFFVRMLNKAICVPELEKTFISKEIKNSCCTQD